MRHVILCPEYPPSPGAAGGIGTYALNFSRLLAESGDTVHVIAERWSGANKPVEELCHGRLIVHRVSPDHPLPVPRHLDQPHIAVRELHALRYSERPQQAFAWQAGLLTEHLVEKEGIDLIESQEWEAPLYYFQLRRALGAGPKRQPPCLVHLHSPAEFIFRHNEWSMGRFGFNTAKRHEDYSIAAADARLCPSRYLARQAERHYGLPDGEVNVIPLPIGETTVVERGADVWRRGTVCYVGRLEPRKGVLEWIDAAVAVAREDRTVQFEFVGADVPYDESRSVLRVLERRIPDSLRRRFRFRGAQPRSRLSRFFAEARIAVVPSRWENFPNTCIEAMCSGLPVLATREGGMAEMIDHGRTGWLARTADAAGLEEALRAALATPPEALSTMGRAAARAIREQCDNTRTVERHIDFRRRVVRGGTARSLRVPANLPWAGRRFDDESARRTPKPSDDDGIAIVVTCLEYGGMLRDCLQSIDDQLRPPAVVVVVVDESHEEERAAARRARAAGWTVRRHPGGSLAAAKNAGLAALLDTGRRPTGVAFVDVADHLDPDFIAACEPVLRERPEIGLVSPWIDHAGAIVLHPCPALPYQLVRNETAPTSVIRTEALIEAGLHRTELYRGWEGWDLANAIMANGWAAVTYPALLATRVTSDLAPTRLLAGHDRMRRELFDRVPDVVRRDAVELLLLLETSLPIPPRPHPPTSGEVFRRSVRDQIALARRVLAHPRAALRWMAPRLRRVLRRPRRR